MARQSKYIMSRLSLHLKKLNFTEIKPISLVSLLIDTKTPLIEPKVIYFNKDKTKALTYYQEFNIVTQYDYVGRDGTVYNRKGITSKEGFELLNLMIRREKLKKIKKKISR